MFPAATGTCTMDGETVPATNVYTAWSEFVSNNPDEQKSKVDLRVLGRLRRDALRACNETE